MIRVALHNSVALPDDDVGSTIERLAEDAGCGSAAIVRFSNAIEAGDVLLGKGSILTDLMIVSEDITGSSGIQTIVESLRTAPLLRSVLIAPSADIAPKAAAAGVNGLVLEPVSTAAFCEAVRQQMQAVVHLQELSFTVAPREGAQRIPYTRVIYCETAGHDQIIHLNDSSSCAIRSSSQALFEILGVDNRFFKVGSSSIVNLDEVVEVRASDSMVELSDGTLLNVPVRVRKNLENALIERA